MLLRRGLLEWWDPEGADNMPHSTLAASAAAAARVAAEVVVVDMRLQQDNHNCGPLCLWGAGVVGDQLQLGGEPASQPLGAMLSAAADLSRARSRLFGSLQRAALHDSLLAAIRANGLDSSGFLMLTDADRLVRLEQLLPGLRLRDEDSAAECAFKLQRRQVRQHPGWGRFGFEPKERPGAQPSQGPRCRPSPNLARAPPPALPRLPLLQEMLAAWDAAKYCPVPACWPGWRPRCRCEPGMH